MKLSSMAIGVAAVGSVLLGLTACGGGSGGSMGGSGGGTGPSGYSITGLVSNRAGVAAAHTDADLVNPWGIVFNPQGFVWVANQGTSTSTLYDGNGVATMPIVAIAPDAAGRPAGPTGIVLNQSSDFVVTAGGVSGASMFIFAGTGGTISGWSTGVNFNSAITAYDGSASGAAFTGLAIGHDTTGNNFIYAADFGTGQVDVFNGSFAKVTPAGGFVDVTVPQGYAPFGIQNIPQSDGTARIYVTYAQPDPATHGSKAGAGLGYVAVFDAEGNLIKHLISGGALDAPWGVAVAPQSFGPMSGALLVGNFGDGTINAYNISTGASMGALMQPNGQPVHAAGLWGLAFGNGINSQPTTTLFFAAGLNAEADGLYGRIDFSSGASGGGSGSSGGSSGGSSSGGSGSSGGY